MVALPEPRPETPRQAERRQAIENVQRSLLGRQLYGSELTPAGLAARRREGIEALKGMGVGLPAGLLGLPADLLALLVRDAPSLLNKLVTGEPLDIEERGQFAKAFDAFQKVAGAEAIARAMGFGENLDAESEGSDAASRAGMNPFRQGMLTTELVADPFLAFKGISSLLKAGSRTDTPATRSTDLVPVGATDDTPTTTTTAPEPERGIVDFTPADADPDDEMDIFSFGVDMFHTPTGRRVPSDTIIRGRISEFETAGGRDASLVNRTEFTQRMATQEETDAFMRGDTPGTAPEGDEANQLFDAASQARALDDVEDTQQATPAQQRTPGPEVGIGATRQADEAMGDLDPAVPEFTYDSLMAIPGYRRKPDRNSQNMVYTVDDTGKFGEKVDNFSPVLTNLHAQEEMKKIPRSGIRPSELDKRLLQGAMKAEYKDSPFQDELLRLADEGDKKIQSVTAIEKAEEFLPQVRSRMFRLSKHPEDYANNKTPYQKDGIPYIGEIDENEIIRRVGDAPQTHEPLKQAADDGALITFSTNKPDSISFDDGSSIDNIPSVMMGHDYGFSGQGGKNIPGYFGWARTYMVTTPDGRKYLVVNEIQSNAVRDYEMGSGAEMPKQLSLKMTLEDENGNLEDILVQNQNDPSVFPDAAGPEVQAVRDRAAAENKTIKDIKAIAKTRKIKTLDERLNAFFETSDQESVNFNVSPTSRRAVSLGETGKVRIPYDAEAKSLQKLSDKLFPEKVVKSNRAEAELDDIEIKRNALQILPSESHPYVALDPNNENFLRIEARSRILQNTDDFGVVLPLAGESDFFNKIDQVATRFDADDVVAEYIESNRSFMEGMIENLLRSAGQPTTVQNVERHIGELKKVMNPAARSYKDGSITPEQFKDEVFRKLEEKEIRARIDIASSALVDALGQTNPAIGKILKGKIPWLSLTEDSTYPMGDDPARVRINEMIDSYSPEVRAKISKAYADKLEELEQTYGGDLLEKTRKDLDENNVLDKFDTSMALATTIGGLGHPYHRPVLELINLDKDWQR